jgi:hypothetical protein
MLSIPLDRDAPALNEPIEKGGTAFRDGGVPSGRSPLSFGSLREES